MQNVIGNVDRLTKAASVEELWCIHQQLMAECGFDRLLYGYTRYRTSNGLGDPRDWVILSTQKPEYMKAFIDDGFYHNAPMIQWALENDGACSWRWLTETASRGNLTPAEMRVMAFNKSMQVTAGYTVSFRSVSQRSKGAIALTAKPGLTQDQVDNMWAENGDAIIVMNNVLHLKLLSLPYSGERKLTTRQREVLQWVGDGKTTQDIAVLLGLTPATIEKHLRLARQTLDAETTAQAILKAAFYNQMFGADSR
ncbi:autoinducer binding domain-containing protein [Yoonia sp.]|uniref:autoinducer binding domain-containing protein n=1 Tax=Yoonia sp. TaxID=2212373 RepID=UPI0035C7BE52